MISELLHTGAGNVVTGRQLAQLLDCDLRQIIAQVERERRAGFPICAGSAREHSGYYLAETAAELAAYCNRIHHRAGEMYKTRGALLVTLEKMKADEESAGPPGITADSGGE